MAFDFPSSPTVGQQFTPVGGVTYTWNGYGWDGGSGILLISDTAPTSPSNGSLWWESDTGTLWIYYTDVNSSQWVAAAGGGAAQSGVLQQVYAELTTYTSCTGNITAGIDTVPQQTDGTQLLTATITPKSATSTLRIDVTVPYACSGALNGWMALFRDSVAAAIGASSGLGAAALDACSTGSFTFEAPSNATVSTTIKLRLGTLSGGTIYINGTSGGRRLGGSSRVTMVITELAP